MASFNYVIMKESAMRNLTSSILFVLNLLLFAPVLLPIFQNPFGDTRIEVQEHAQALPTRYRPLSK